MKLNLDQIEAIRAAVPELAAPRYLCFEVGVRFNRAQPEYDDVLRLNDIFPRKLNSGEVVL